MLVTSIFFFSHNVFKRLFLQSCLKFGLYGKELKSNVYAQSAHRLTFVCLFVCLFVWGFIPYRQYFVFHLDPSSTIKARTVCYVHVSMGESHTVVSAYTLYWHLQYSESHTVVSAYTLYWHLQQYCSHPSILHQHYFLYTCISW